MRPVDVLVTAASLVAAALTGAVADEVVPLVEQHWRDAPPTVLERETGVPAAVIEEQRLKEREIDPYPSIPGNAGPPPATRKQQETPSDAFPLPHR